MITGLIPKNPCSVLVYTICEKVCMSLKFLFPNFLSLTEVDGYPVSTPMIQHREWAHIV